jgi:predicted alpha/beta-fold hydrolase
LLTITAVGFAGWLLVRPHRTVVGPPPAAFATTSVKITTSDGLVLSGWFVRGAPGAGAVVLMHGVRSDRRENVGVAQELARRRFSVLLFDFRAEGESEGDRISMGALESEDARAALDFVRREMPGEKVGAIGRSMGGAAALLGARSARRRRARAGVGLPEIEQATDARMRRTWARWDRGSRLC